MRIRVGTTRLNELTDFIITGVVCPKCNQVFNAYMNRTVQTSTIMFIPIANVTIQRYTICPHCGLRYIFPANMYRDIKNQPTSNILYPKCHAILYSSREEFEKYAIRSEKKVWIASLLSLFLGLFGAQNWYMGHFKRAIVSCVLDIIGIVMLLIGVMADLTDVTDTLALTYLIAIPFCANIYWGFFDMIRIITGHAKDNKGLYIMTNHQHINRLKRRNDLY